MHLSQIDRKATYDSGRPMLEINGTTDGDTASPALVAIHVAFKQGDGDEVTEIHGLVPEACLGDAKWMVRFEGEYETGPATVFAIAISYESENGSLQTQTWAQSIDIQAGTVYADPRWDPPGGESDDDGPATVA